MAACLPTYRSLLRYVLQRLGFSMGSSQGSRFDTRDDTLRTIGDHSAMLTAVQAKNGKGVFVSSIEDSLNELDRLGTETDERVLVNSVAREMKQYPSQDGQEGKSDSSDDGDAASTQDSGCAIKSRDSGCSSPPLGTIRVERDYKVISSRREVGG